MRIEIDSGGYSSACGYFYEANHAVIDAVSTCWNGVTDGGGMAGTDTGGEAFAQQYDAVAGELIQAGADLGESMGQMANLLNAALVNHAGADYGATVGAGPDGGGFDGDSDPDHWTETLYAPAPPSAAGGIGGEPGWWHWIAGHVEGLLWPDADTGKLRSVGKAWTTAGESLGAAAYLVDDARVEVSVQTSPEVTDAVATCNELKQHLTDVAAAYGQIGEACSSYADQVDAHHKEIVDELASFIEWTAVIEGGGFFLGLATAGLGELAAQAGEGAEVANAAAKVVKVLKDLIEVARAAALKLGDLLKTATAAIERARLVLSAKIVKALKGLAPAVTDETRALLLRELEEAGIKHDPAQIVTIFRNADGKIVFIEKGNARSGLEHIVKEHAGQFASKGISEEQIPDLIQTALTEGKVIGTQGRSRTIYEVTYEGKQVKVAIQVSENGYVVSANPRS